MNYHFITIEGNIGAGKTTLAHMLAKHYNGRLILEQFADNPFLPKFYENPQQYAFPLELFFMAERFKQLKDLLQQKDMFHSLTISDYLFTKCLLFSKINLSDEEFRLYQRLFEIVNHQLIQPDILIYLHAPVNKLQENIRKRKRSYEQTIPDDYLFKIQETYTQYIKQHNLKTIIIDTSNADFLGNEKHLTTVIEALEKEYEEGATLPNVTLDRENMSLPKDKKDNFAALRFIEFRNYVISRFFFIIVLTMQATIISWKVYELTRDTFSIGMLGLVEFVPAFLLAFYSGYVIDRGDKRNLLLYSMIGNTVLTCILCFITSNYALGTYPQTWILFIIFFIVFGIGMLRPFTGPTSFALLSQLVPKQHLANATMWNSGSWQVAAVTGPALAGVLYGLAGITYTFYVMLGMMLIALTGLSLVKRKPVLNQMREESIVESVKQGFRFVWRSKEVLGAMSLDLFAVLFGGATALLPAFADKILHVGAEGLGILRAAPALGGVTVLLLLAFRPLHRQQGRIMLACVAGFGISIIVFGLSQLFWLSFFALFASGILDGISVIVRSTILQLKTPDHMKGRVASLNSIFIMSSNELGAFESGVTSRLMGNVVAVVFGGCMTIGIVVYTWFKAPSLRKLEY